jgi:hypothetical protein
VLCQPVTPVDSFLCRVADMLADMSATHRPDRHMSVISTLVLTCQHPTLPAKAGKSDFIVACRWHHTWTLSRTKVLGKLACLVLSKILGIGTAECNWKQVKKIKYGDHANLGTKVTANITNIYGHYQQVKSHNRDDQRSSIGRLWQRRTSIA